LVRQRNRTRKSATPFDPTQLDVILSKVQLGILLTAVVVVPLVVLPESHFVDITSTPKTTILRFLGSLQIGVMLSRLAIAASRSTGHNLGESLRSLGQSRASTAILLSIAAVTVVSLLSTVFSILPHQSWWGRVPAGFEAGESTTLMYVAFAASAFISLREHSPTMLPQTMAATGILAALVGFLQYLGFSPLDISQTHQARVTGTNGNPIFFGAMLVVLSPITFGVLLQNQESGTKVGRRWWLGAIAVFSMLVAISLVSTGSRGPLVGGFAGVIVAIILVASSGRIKLRSLQLAVLVFFLILGGMIATFNDPTQEATPGPADTDVGAKSKTSESIVNNTLSNIGRTNTLDLRLRYWRLSKDMVLDRDPVPFSSDKPKIIRWFFGYGPDTFRFAGTYFSDSTTFTRRLTAAHNDPINRLVEQGFLGFLAWVSLWISLAYGSLLLIRRIRSSSNNHLHWISIGIVVALSARFVEQLFGSPTPGGVLVFWVIVGILAGMLSKPLLADVRNSPSIAKRTVPNTLVYVGVAAILIGSVAVGWIKGSNYLIANQMASFLYRLDTVSREDAIDRLEQVTNLAPDVPRYWHDLADIEHGWANATQNPLTRNEALSRAYEYDLKGYEANPLEVSSIYRLAFSAWESGNAGRPELRSQAVNLYERLTVIIPSDELAHERLEILRNAINQ